MAVCWPCMGGKAGVRTCDLWAEAVSQSLGNLIAAIKFTRKYNRRAILFTRKYGSV